MQRPGPGRRVTSRHRCDPKLWQSQRQRRCQFPGSKAHPHPRNCASLDSFLAASRANADERVRPHANAHCELPVDSGGAAPNPANYALAQANVPPLQSLDRCHTRQIVRPQRHLPARLSPRSSSTTTRSAGWKHPHRAHRADQYLIGKPQHTVLCGLDDMVANIWQSRRDRPRKIGFIETRVFWEAERINRHRPTRRLGLSGKNGHDGAIDATAQ